MLWFPKQRFSRAARRGAWMLVWSLGYLAPGAAQAASPAPAAAAPSRAAADVELGLKAFDGEGVGVGTLGLGLDVLIFPSLHYGLGVSLGAFYVNNGADPHYSSSGTLKSGQRVLAFAELDLFDYAVTPYTRLGLGLGPTERWNGRGDAEDHLDFMAEATLGAAARLGPLVVRAFASPSLFGEDFIVQYGFGLGGHFCVGGGC